MVRTQLMGIREHVCIVLKGGVPCTVMYCYNHAFWFHLISTGIQACTTILMTELMMNTIDRVLMVKTEYNIPIP